MKSLTPARRADRLFKPLAVAACLLMVVMMSWTALAYTPNFKPSARFDRMWVDYGVTENGKLGMKIHIKFTVYELKGIATQIRIKFKDSMGNDLKDNNKSYYTENGNVAVFGDLNPGYEPTVYEDFTIFMPYSEFDITRPGKYNLRMNTSLIYPSGVFIQHLTDYDFEYTRAAPSTTTPVKFTTTFDSAWIDYDVTENGQLGMRIHAKFTVKNMMGIDGYLVATFQRADGSAIKSTDGTFESTTGNVAAYRSMKPGYEPAVYSDLTVFMPYSEIHLPPGQYNLKVDLDVINKDASVNEHLTYYEFSFRKR